MSKSKYKITVKTAGWEKEEIPDLHPQPKLKESVQKVERVSVWHGG